jgi:hypothetical protein
MNKYLCGDLSKVPTRNPITHRTIKPHGSTYDKLGMQCYDYGYDFVPCRPGYVRNPDTRRCRSKSPRRRSKSPKRRSSSKSPRRRNSKSPKRRSSSKSPRRRNSKSPKRRSSKSPHRRSSKSPKRRKSPHRRSSKSPLTSRRSPAAINSGSGRSRSVRLMRLYDQIVQPPQMSNRRSPTPLTRRSSPTPLTRRSSPTPLTRRSSPAAINYGSGRSRSELLRLYDQIVQPPQMSSTSSGSRASWRSALNSPS